MQNEMGKLMQCVWGGWYQVDNKGGWLDPDLCVQARREEVEYIRRHKMHKRVS